MRITPRAIALPLAGVAILLSGCNEPGATASSAPLKDVPATLTGELTSQSAVNLNDGSRNQSFDLQLKGGTLYRVTSSGSLQQPKLTLLSGDNQLIDGPRTEQLFLQPEQDGVYRLAISAGSAKDFGPFRLELNTAEAVNGGELEAGADILGQLQPKTSSGGNRYTFKVSKSGPYEIVLRSGEFDAVLKLRGKGVNQTDDDSGGGTDARLLATLQEGSYQLIAGGIDSADEGVYSLSIKAWELPEGVNLADGAELTLGEEYTGMMMGQPQTYTLTVEQRGLLRLSMRSGDLDSMLELSGPGTNVSDDDSGGGVDALISTVVEPGTYRIKANSYSNGEGMFTLQAELGEAQVLEGNIAPGESRIGRLTSGDSVTSVLSISEPGHYRVTLSSSQFDALLSLAGQGLEEQDDDSAGGTNAQLELWLDAGDYQLTSGSYADQGAGSFELSVSSAM